MSRLQPSGINPRNCLPGMRLRLIGHHALPELVYHLVIPFSATMSGQDAVSVLPAHGVAMRTVLS